MGALRFGPTFAASVVALGLASAPIPQDPARGNQSGGIPKVWDDAAMPMLEVPLAEPSASPKHVSAEFYYRNVPTGWKGPRGTTTRAVDGHDFGLYLTIEERKALIAFLKTL